MFLSYNIKSKRFLAITAAVIICLSGCANLNSIHRKASIENGYSQLIDAKQRAIISVRQQGVDGNGDIYRESTRVCSEPSPDALSVFASAGGIGVDTAKKANVFGKLASAEAGGSIGLRTQSIQLLRDSFYRTCEAYLNGGIDELEYGLQMRRFQTSMIALIAIEQLTGVVRAPSLSLGATGSLSQGEILEKLLISRTNLATQKTQFEAAKKSADEKAAELGTQIKTAKEELKTKKDAQSTLDADGDGKPDDSANQATFDANATAIKTAETNISGLEGKKKTQDELSTKTAGDITAAETAISAIDKNIASAEIGNLATQTAAFTNTALAANTLAALKDGQTQRHVADVVQTITSKMIDRDLGPTLCFDYIRHAARETLETGYNQSLIDKCAKIMSIYVEDLGKRALAADQIRVYNRDIAKNNYELSQIQLRQAVALEAAARKKAAEATSNQNESQPSSSGQTDDSVATNSSTQLAGAPVIESQARKYLPGLNLYSQPSFYSSNVEIKDLLELNRLKLEELKREESLSDNFGGIKITSDQDLFNE